LEKEENLIDGIKFIKGNSGDIIKLNVNFGAILHNGIPSYSPMYKQNPILEKEKNIKEIMQT